MSRTFQRRQISKPKISTNRKERNKREEIGREKKKYKEYPKYRVAPTRFGIPVGNSCNWLEWFVLGWLGGCGAPRAGCPLSGVRGPIRRSV
jgi:hypothetical protein